MEYQYFLKQLKKEREIYIYGAGVVAYGAFMAIKKMYGILCKAFLVSQNAGNQSEIDGIPVREELSVLEKETFILIATPEQYHEEISTYLQENGIYNYIKLTSYLEYCLMGDYLAKEIGIKRVEDFSILSALNQKKDILVAMAVSHQDKVLKENYKNPTWVEQIQVGAVLTETTIAEKKDNIGKNISKQNPLYGELTASYWLWQNECHDIMGLFHYRRVLHITEKQLELLQGNDVDVLLPLPFVCYPDASGQYGRYLTKEDIEILYNILQEDYVSFWEKAKEKLKEPYLYNYNMLVAKKRFLQTIVNGYFRY